MGVCGRLVFVAALLGLLSVAGRAEADTVYTLSGTFGSTGPVPGGSFSGTYGGCRHLPLVQAMGLERYL